MSRNDVVAGCASALLLVSVTTWYWMSRSGKSNERLEQLQAEVFSDETRHLSDAERRERFAQYREQIEQLTTAAHGVSRCSLGVSNA